MKKIYLVLMLIAWNGHVVADNVVTEGYKKYILDESKKSDSLLNAIKRSKNLSENGQSRRDAIDNLGLGELEKIAVSHSPIDEDKILQYRGANTNLLFSLLENPIFQSSWHNIGVIIGFVGNEDNASKLAQFISSPMKIEPQGIKEYHYDARVGAMIGLYHVSTHIELPWIKEFMVSHSFVDRWVRELALDQTEHKTAIILTQKTASAIAKIGNTESIDMLIEIRNRYLSSETFESNAIGTEQAFTKESLDTLILTSQKIKQLRDKHLTSLE